MAPDLATLANLATSLAVIVALALGLLQWRQFERKRREAGAFEAIHALQSPEFIRAMSVLASMPEGLALAQVRALGRETVQAIEQAGTVIETLAVMIHRGTVDITIVDDIYGAFIRMSWRKARPYCEEVRKEMGNANFGEWWQWLAERIEELDRPGKRLGAHVAYRGWRP